MRLKNVVMSKKFLASAGVMVLCLGFVSYLIFGGEKKRPPNYSDISTVPNPSPLNPASSPNVDRAHREEIEWLKRHGKYFEWGKDALMGDRAERTEHVGPAPSGSIAKPATTYVHQGSEEERRMIWETFWKNFPPDKAEGALVSLAAATQGSLQQTGATGTASSLPFRTGCPFKATVMRSTFATLNDENPILMEVQDPANCAKLPVGTLIMGIAKADYSSFRAKVKLSSISLPNGTSMNVKGFALGPDGVPGVGHQVVRNDRKTLGLASLFAGIGAGFEASREDSQEIVCDRWGCMQQTTKNDNRLQEGVRQGVATFMGGLARGIVGEYQQVSPIVITIPQGFPIEVILEGGQNG